MVSAGETRSSPFAITAASNTVRLDAGKTAVTTFTVSNSTAHTVNGRAQLRSQSPEAASWFKLSGLPERLFPANEAAQFSVDIAVPAGALAGSYVFSLDMVGVDNPDELFSQGPPVSLEVAAVDVPKKSLPWWWWIPVAVTGVLVVAVLAFVLLRSDDEPSNVTAKRTLTATGPIDLDISSPVTQPSKQDDLQYVVIGDSHLFSAFNGARIFSSTTTNSPQKPEDCGDQNGSDPGLVGVKQGVTTTMCVLSNTGAVSLVTASLVTRPNRTPDTGIFNPSSGDKIARTLNLALSTTSPAELAGIRQLLEAGAVRPSPLPQQFNVSLNYTTMKP
jgi:hypothetical protein